MVAQSIRRVTRLLPLMLLTGCFYTDPINQRPSADIVQESSTTPARGGTVMLSATGTDPENQQIEFSWQVWACTDATVPGDCDVVPFQTGILTEFDFMVPPLRQDNQTAVQSLLVILEATDELGATAKPAQQLILPVSDAPPVLMLSKSSQCQGCTRPDDYVDGRQFDLFATYSDADDGPQNVTLVWTYFTPVEGDAFDHPDFTLPSPGSGQLAVGQHFTPHGAGDWMVVVKASDPLGATDTETLAFTISPDQPPCIEDASPIAPLDGINAVPITEPTLFQVPVVVDDLDPYPASATGGATFAWSLLPPGASTFQALATTGNSVDFDPAAYTPGDLVELRVEISDRAHGAPACPAADLTCSLGGVSSCIQRLTWRVEVH